jgi:hypothetical protein
MNKAQAAGLREKWSKLVHPSPCDHLNQEMENTADGYLTGIYYCTACGASVPHTVIPQR